MTYLFLLLINYMSGMSLHAFHVSVCEIEFDQDKKQLEITHRIFLDDLEMGLINWSGEKIDILNPSDPKRLDNLIGQYLSEKTSYTLNGKTVRVNYLGSEKEDAVMYCYQVVSEVKKLKSIKISNTVLMETYGDQSNVVHVERLSETKSLKLSKGESSGEVRFD